MSHGEQVKHGVCAAAHCYIECHRIKESISCGNASRKHRGVLEVVILVAVFNYLLCSLGKQCLALCVCCKDGPISGESKTDCFVKAIHRIGGEHSGAASATGASESLQFGNLLVIHTAVGWVDHHIYQVKSSASHHARFHRSAGNENRGDVKPHGCHEHTGSDFVAVAYAHHCIGEMGIHHILDAVGNQVARRQRIQHAVMPHGNTIVYCDSVEFGCITTEFLYLRFNKLPNLMKVCVSRHKLSKRVDYRNDRFPHLLLFHAVCPP